MGPAGSGGRRGEVLVNLLSGLPHERSIGPVLADRDASPRFLRTAGDEKDLERRQDEAARKLLEQLRYHRSLLERPMPRRTHLELSLRRIEELAHTAYFTTVFQRYDPGEGVFVRYTIQLAQSSSRWTKPIVELQGDDLEHTRPFANVISRYHSDEAEFAFILLSDLTNIAVEEVCRGRVGPLWFEGVHMPPDIDELLGAYPGNFILHLPFERVAPAVKEDRNLDPYGVFYRQSLQPAAKDLADARAEKLGYKVYKERKFCVTRGVAAPFKELLASHGARCVVYSV